MTSRATTLTVAAMMLVALISVAVLLPVPYVTMKPGQTVNTLGDTSQGPVIEFGPDVRTYHDHGQLRMTTVSVTSPDSHVGLLQAIDGWFDTSTAVVPRDLVYPPDQSVQQAEQQTHLEMTGSQASAQIAGLKAAGYNVKEQVQITSVTPGSPADGKLKPGDQLTAVDGQPVKSSQAAVDAVRDRKPGDPVKLTVERNANSRTFTITTEPSPDDSSVPIVGVALGVVPDFPFPIHFNVDPNIGGPSAGTMFALAIYDRLTPGSLTDGQVIAGTGEITSNGKVGAIGGVQQKIIASEDVGAKFFLVPKANCGEASQVGLDGMRLVEIDTLHSAIDSLETLAKNPDASVPDCE
jgi:Lon-like protease